MIIRGRLILVLTIALVSCGKKDISGDEIFIDRNEIITEQGELASLIHLALLNDCQENYDNSDSDAALLNCENAINSTTNLKNKNYNLGGIKQDRFLWQSNRPIVFEELLILSNNRDLIVFDTTKNKVVGRIDIRSLLDTMYLSQLSQITISKIDDEVIILGNNGLVAMYKIDSLLNQYRRWRSEKKFFHNPLNIKISPIWKVKIDANFNNTATMLGNSIYILSTDDVLFMLDKNSGQVIDQNRRLRTSTVSTNITATLLKYKEQIIACFGNGDIVSYSNLEGKLHHNWEYNIIQDGNALQKNIKSFDIDFQPTIINNTLFVGGIFGGFMSINLFSGIPTISKDVSVVSNIANNYKFLFFIDNSYNLLAINSQTLGIVWHKQLDKFIDKGAFMRIFTKNTKSSKKKIYTGPFFINGQIGLIVDSGQLLFLDVTNGYINRTEEIATEIYSLPVNIDKKLYLIDKNNVLHTYY